jgi:hypothetical protein
LTVIPLPPHRPADLAPPVVVAALDGPSRRDPPARPADEALPGPGLLHLMAGAQPVLATARFMPVHWQFR